MNEEKRISQKGGKRRGRACLGKTKRTRVQSMKQKSATGKAERSRRNRTSGMKLTPSRTLGEAARSPAGPAFVASPLSLSFKHRSASKISLSGEERREPGG